MSLREAISGVIADAGMCMLVPALLVIVPADALGAVKTRVSFAGATVSPHPASGKPKKESQATAGAPDGYLLDEFSGPALQMEPAKKPSGRRMHKVAAEEPPLHGYGTFEGVVLVPPAASGAGMVLVEPAAATVKQPLPAEAPAEAATDDMQVPKDLSEQQNDPFESFNRGIFGINDMLDHVVLEPTARIYHAIVPPPVRQGITNALRNLSSPVILANDILQGNRKRAADTIVRFMVNSTIGLGGLVDAAGYMGVPYHSEDFGQTLAVWGAEPGPYMVLPILGPSNPRDAAGKLVDTAINPLTWILFDAPLAERLAPSGVELVSGREAILDDYASLRKTSFDLYASVRDIYGQVRQTEISNGDVTGEPLPGVTSLPPSSMTTVKPF